MSSCAYSICLQIAREGQESSAWLLYAHGYLTFGLKFEVGSVVMMPKVPGLPARFKSLEPLSRVAVLSGGYAWLYVNPIAMTRHLCS